MSRPSRADSLRLKRRGFLLALVCLAAFSVAQMAKSLSTRYLTADGETYTISVSYNKEANIPDGATLDVSEITKENVLYAKYANQAAEKLSTNSDKLANAHFFDISIVKGGQEIQPQAPVDVKIELSDELSTSVKAIHFNEAIETITPTVAFSDAPSRNSAISFEATSFSVYGIVELPAYEQTYAPGWHVVSDISTFDALAGQNIGFYISHVDGYYYTGEPYAINSTRTGIKKTAKYNDPDLAEAAGAVPYYFEKQTGTTDKYYAYFFDNDHTKKYIKQSTTSLIFVSDKSDATQFEISNFASSTDIFRIRGDGDYCWNMQGGTNGHAFAAWDNLNDNNARMRFKYKMNGDEGDELVNLDGQSFSIVRYNKSEPTINSQSYHGAGLTTTQHATNSSNLKAESTTGKIEHINFFQDYLVTDNDLVTWSFEHQTGNYNYYLSTEIGGSKKYLSYADDGTGSLSLVLIDEPGAHALIRLNLGSGQHAGMMNLEFENADLYLDVQNDNYNNGFRCTRKTGNPLESSWLYLAQPASLSNSDFKTFTAEKISVSEIQNGQNVIIYTRVWDETANKYKYYAIDHDGSLIRAYDNGEDIRYVSTTENTPLFAFTEYYYEGTTTPNYYFELQNNHSQKYLAPQLANNQTLSDNTIGLTIEGRRYGDYYSQILAWDNSYFDYAGLNIASNELSSVRMANSADWYFAIVSEETDELTTVQTVNHEYYGISMKMVDFNYEKFGSNNSFDVFLQEIMGDSTTPKVKKNLVYRNLDTNGYAKTTNTDRSFSELFGDAYPVNNLFIQRVYDESGYFEYDSTQNYAYLGDQTNFTVYNQLGTLNGQDKPSLEHGQFYPYNQIYAGQYSNKTNRYDIFVNQLPTRDPRYMERLYSVPIEDIDWHFGMVVEATFAQSVDGKDNWGHDIIFEFSGDDDMWLFVDGMLVIDLGGIHSAASGNVNFRTGAVQQEGSNDTNLRALFKAAYLENHSSASDNEVEDWLDTIFKNGTSVFKDYTSHKMKMIYMERGGSSSNLHMRFNLSPITTGRAEMEKKISGTDQQDYVSTAFPFQIFRKQPGDADYTQVTAADVIVFYKESGQPVNSTNMPDYGDVFLVKPGQKIYVYFGDDETEYYVRECAVNSLIYDYASVNNQVVNGIVNSTGIVDYTSSSSTVDDRRLLTFDNHVNESSLRTLTLQKHVYTASHGGTELQSTDETDPTTYDDGKFNFRLYLGEDYSYYRLGKYYVKDPSGHYCTYDNVTGKYISTSATSLDDLTNEEKALATFTTSPSGAASNIPAQYSIEIRNLLPEMYFKVEERINEIPDGYNLIDYERVNGSYITPDQNNLNIGEIRYGVDAKINTNNTIGYTIKVKKIWSDDDFIASRDTIYFAIYESATATTPIAIQSMETNERNIRFFQETITGSLSDYVVREVSLVNPSVDSDGNVTAYDSITIINDLTTINIIEKGETTPKSASYVSSHAQGGLQGRRQNIREDTFTNTRNGGIYIYKIDRNGTPLQNATFSLTDNNGDTVGKGTYISDENGLLGVMYLNQSRSYTLKETAAPDGYFTIPISVPFTVNAAGDKVTLSSGDFSEIATVSTTTNENDTLKIINSKIALPATGGPGNKASLIIGVVILTTSLLTFAYYFHARRRREEGS